MKKLMLILTLCSVLIFSIACEEKTNNQATQVEQTKQAEIAVGTTEQQQTYDNKNYVKYVDVSDIVKDNSTLDSDTKKYYSKYIDYTAPNGKPIRIVAMDKVSDEQMLKAYNLLSFYLTSNDNYDKTAIANAMADKGALLNMLNGADGDGSAPDEALMGQPLYQMEVPVAGSKWYQKNDYEHRDASYEEIFHIVHDYGIGTTQNSGAMPEVTNKIKAGLDSVLPKNQADWVKKVSGA